MKPDNTPPASDEWRGNPKKKKKDTSRWCKGRTGQSHDYQIILNPKLDYLYERLREKNGGDLCYTSWGGHWHCNHIQKCTKCGKEKWWGFDCPDRPK